ncbi:helix-turn-helix domain-containing protein [Azospirillum formosense]|uniref:helix-turn-helix domain-containing protein n=1 Tax=Azospirillum formosense TaxID=861533 RepID=UPI003CCE8BC1
MAGQPPRIARRGRAGAGRQRRRHRGGSPPLPGRQARGPPAPGRSWRPLTQTVGTGLDSRRPAAAPLPPGETARFLGLSRKTLYNKMRHYGLLE